MLAAAKSDQCFIAPIMQPPLPAQQHLIRYYHSSKISAIYAVYLTWILDWVRILLFPVPETIIILHSSTHVVQ